MTESTKRELVDRYLAAYTAFDVPGMLSMLSPDIAFENYANGQLTASAQGIEEFRRLAETSRELFSERRQSLVSLRVEVDHAIAVVEFRGRLARDIENGPRAGAEITITGKSEFAFRDGLITRIVDRS